MIHRDGVDYRTPFSSVIESLPGGGSVEIPGVLTYKGVVNAQTGEPPQNPGEIWLLLVAGGLPSTWVPQGATNGDYLTYAEDTNGDFAWRLIGNAAGIDFDAYVLKEDALKAENALTIEVSKKADKSELGDQAQIERNARAITGLDNSLMAHYDQSHETYLALDQAIQGTNNRVDSLDRRVTVLEEQDPSGSDYDEQIKQLETDIKFCLSACQDLGKDMSDLSRDVREIKEQLAAQDAKLEEQDAKLEEQDQKLEEQDTYAKENRGLITTLDQLIKTHNHESDYATKNHKHNKSNEPLCGPARYQWKYVSGGVDPREQKVSISADENTIKLSVIPYEPYCTMNMLSEDNEMLRIDESLGVYRYYYKDNTTGHRKYQWELVGLAEINYITYRKPSSGWYHEIAVNRWRRNMQITPAEGSGLWIVISGLLA